MQVKTDQYYSNIYELYLLGGFGQTEGAEKLLNQQIEQDNFDIDAFRYRFDEMTDTDELFGVPLRIKLCLYRDGTYDFDFELYEVEEGIEGRKLVGIESFVILGVCAFADDFKRIFDTKLGPYGIDVDAFCRLCDQRTSAAELIDWRVPISAYLYDDRSFEMEFARNQYLGNPRAMKKQNSGYALKL